MKQIFLIGALVTALVGCASTQIFDYYRLQATASVTDHKVDMRVGVAPVALTGWFDSGVLSWSDGYRVHRSENNRWGADIQQQIEHVLSVNLGRQLAGSQVTVGPWLGGNRPDRVVFVEIEDVAFVDGSVEMRLFWRIENRLRETFFRRGESTVAAEVAAGRPKEEQLVQGISAVLARLSEQVVVQLLQLETKKQEPFLAP
ncbi:PqiC family protein [Sansalvadorimonas verongulae]|uniref:PqiC family protein n=1 Tax=Sansalvadorimonas verongulae TaxID=2172824 RepID=UPI0012BD30B6|nr:ABC-type transport auxiliary lipoprotein family protein [Sansalvadorimonas verongulae]MTI14724.1 membrane integrity-associated transporter subunit PqiC [Sansalvadorimonas verongulae]